MNNNNENEFTEKDFADALLELKQKSGLSYMQIAIRTGLSDTYLVNIVKRKNLAPKNENIEKIAKVFNKKPEYFKEYRTRWWKNYLNGVRDDIPPLSDKEQLKIKEALEKYR